MPFPPCKESGAKRTCHPGVPLVDHIPIPKFCYSYPDGHLQILCKPFPRPSQTDADRVRIDISWMFGTSTACTSGFSWCGKGEEMRGVGGELRPAIPVLFHLITEFEEPDF
jgi:hypothetical protein